MRNIWTRINRPLNYFFFVVTKQFKKWRFWSKEDYWLFMGRLTTSVFSMVLFTSAILIILLCVGFYFPYSIQTFGAILTWGAIIFHFRYSNSLFYKLEEQFDDEQNIGVKCTFFLALIPILFAVMFFLADKTGMYTVGHVSAIHKYTRLFTFH